MANSLPIVKLLLDYGIDVHAKSDGMILDYQNFSTLHLAVFHQDPQYLSLILDASVKIDLKVYNQSIY
jgi:hypothetical protein